MPTLHIPLVVTSSVSFAALAVTAFSRSLNKSNSGNGAGLTGQPATSTVETATPPQILTAAGASVIEVLVPRLPPEIQIVAAGIISGLFTDHLKAEGVEAQAQASEKKKNLTLMGDLVAAADARTSASQPPIMGESTVSPIGDTPAAALAAEPSIFGTDAAASTAPSLPLQNQPVQVGGLPQ